MGSAETLRWLFASAMLATLAHCGARSGLALAGGGRDGGTGGGDAGAHTCMPRPEACNGADDDCDGLVDEELAIGPIGDPIVVRNDEGDTGDCSSCRSASGPDLWIGDAGLLATWYVAFSGSDPQSNLYARRLAVDGAPLGPPFLLLGATVQTPRLAPRTSDRALLAFCRRVGALDRPGTIELDFRGNVLGAITDRSPTTSHCRPISRIAATWTGERFVVAWNNAEAPFGVALDIADSAGRSLSTRWLEQGGGTPVRLAAGHRGLLLATTREQAPPGATLVFHRLDAFGESIGSPVDLATSDPLLDTAIASIREGWLVYAWGSDFGAAITIATDGAIASINELERDPQGVGFSMAPRPGGGYVTVEWRVRRVALPAIVRWHRANGALEAEWRAPDDEPMSDISVTDRNGTTWLAYRAQTQSSLPNQIRLRRFGCQDAPCPGADVAYLRERFVSCADGGRVGQNANAPGATCRDVCCALGFPGCSHRAAQSGFGACNIDDPMASGGCDDVFREQWSSQCICTP